VARREAPHHAAAVVLRQAVLLEQVVVVVVVRGKGALRLASVACPRARRAVPAGLTVLLLTVSARAGAARLVLFPGPKQRLGILPPYTRTRASAMSSTTHR